ncbi:histidinol-phosphatase HisJ family protein [Youngiibacter multivorans]|uniref:Histidinol-phosphatase n=1 Tax=Youngiibacter multivorans TaxID=937251 RepID=A0ABS4G3H7_9CLOT|nr:histidinol-phosphatase HisJ family protein [Youngiibacter multivorans]MBP1919091.1 histidinol-phosphatase (PHP family) [Youngiibacter multivorans]
MIADYHVHTSFSDDSVYPMEEVVRKAISIGLQEICFTEHVDHGVKTEDNCDYPAYVKEFGRCSEKYGTEIGLKLGIEFGMQVHTIDQFQRDFDEYDFDFVIMSCHQVGDKEFWTKDFQKGKTQKEYNEKYYVEILKVIRTYKDYSVLGHLDMIKRYDDEGDYPFEKVEGLIREILETVIRDGKGIEVNTSSFRYGLNDLTPSVDILKLYRSLGGEIITIGSDSHAESHLGYKIGEVQGILKGLGFSHIHTFERMKPIAHDI